MGVAADEKGREEKGEQAMVAGILEGSPEAVGVAVVRLDCGCRAFKFRIRLNEAVITFFSCCQVNQLVEIE